MKTSSNGEVEWRKSFTKVDDPNHVTPTIYVYSKPYIIVETADQGYVVAGCGTDNFWMFKVDSQGNVVWSKIYIRSEEDPKGSSLNSMIQTFDGGYALAGSTETSEGGRDFWLVKIDSNGKAQWNQTYNSGFYKDSLGYEYPREDEAKSLVQTRDGGYALAGSASLYRASTSSVVYASWVVKTDSQGKQLWNKGYDSPNDPAREYGILQTADGGYAIAGTQNEDFYLMKIDLTSQLQWSKKYGDKGSDIMCALVQLNDGGFAMAGTWTKINTTVTVSAMGLLRLDSSGQMVWTKTYTAKENATDISRDSANAMIRTKDGSYVITGSTVFGNEYHQDVFFVKTESLEQPPQPTATPTVSSSVAPTVAPSGVPADSPSTSADSSATPFSSPMQTSTASGSSPSPSPSIPEIPLWLTISVIFAATALFLSLRGKKWCQI
jgi:predicted secreted protein